MESIRSFPMPRSRSTHIWDRQFATRQLISYKAEDTRIQPKPTKTQVAAFLAVRSGGLDPPGLNFKQLESFLNRADLEDLRDRTRPARLSHLALVDDRREPSGLYEG